ncbi:sensor histidine kinase [Brumimicrobium aurantiacum]|uniref:histidine kinase n=1 Tax=Brumimicrobium aurantiacum TaxID=1737063 RepID=A0A3E1F0F0_9FLAO|nr:HAMP domain-containing sensor histidine kinase [Brumimicrobium aurantiacum]RFC55302.1 sensor histidine kinase [Brumimicrobium aurantiacum]
MKIKHKILTYISISVIPIVAVTFVLIYILFSGYREEEFQQQQNTKIIATVKLIEQFKDQSAKISYLLDEQDINDFYDEKLLIFNENKEEIFTSLDDLDIYKVKPLINNLSSENSWIETKEGEYDLIGVYIERNGEVYYAISKAFDASGYTKLEFLRNILILTFLLITIAIVVVSIYISRMIANPITELASKINNYELDKENNLPILLNTSTIELNTLSTRFNELLIHTNDVFKFQKHTINHISHQLKTPITILVTELEKIQDQTNEIEIQQKINLQKIKAQSLGNIINVLLEISKIDSGQNIKNKKRRVDELLYDCINELNIIYPDFIFDVNYSPMNFEEKYLMVEMNPILLKQAFSNLLSNAISYSSKKNADIFIEITSENQLTIQFTNSGDSITNEEEKFLFKHFFRGQNSLNKSGQGLGLILTKRIIELHNASIYYSRKEGLNVFEIKFPLS